MKDFWHWIIVAVAVVAFSYSVSILINWLIDDFDMTPYDKSKDE